jgi:hypothetical protein
MDAAQLSRWTRFASKGGIGKCIAQQDCVAREPDDLMFLKVRISLPPMLSLNLPPGRRNHRFDAASRRGRHIPRASTSLLSLATLTCVFRQGYCEDVVGRFAAKYVQFNGKLKTPVITKRSSSISKSPRPRSLTPSRKRPPSQGSAPSISRAPSRAEDPSAFPRPSSTVPNPESSRQSPSHTEPSNHDSLIASSTSHSSSSSSTQDPPFPPTPSDSYVEPLARDKYAVPGLDVSHVPENDQTPLRVVVPHSSPQRDPASDTPRSSNDSAPTSQHSPPSPQVISPASPSRTEPALTSVPPLGVGNATTDRTSHVSVAMSDGAADIGWSMLQGFENADDDDDDGGSGTDGGDERDELDERTSLDDTVDGFPAPPTQIPTSSRAPSLVLDVLRPPSTHSDYSEEDGDGASFYDNYRYSRQSVSSKMSKSSTHALVLDPPPIPTEPPPSVRQSLDSQLSTPTSPMAIDSVPPSPSSHGTPPPTARLPTRNVPPPLSLGVKPSHATAPSLSTLASPLLHTGFASPLSSPPMGSNTTASRSPLSPVFDFRGGGAASALRQKIESERGSPLPSPLPSANSQERTFDQPKPQRTVVAADKEEVHVPSPSPRGAQPPTPISPTVSTSSSGSGKKKRGGPLPLVVMNPAPPPPYTPTSPVTPSPLSPTYSPMPMPSPVVPRRVSPQPTVVNTAEPGPSKPRASLFLPHPNAPKPSVSSQGPLYWRSMPPAPPRPPASGLVQTLLRAAQMRVGPNGHLQFCTIYASTTQDLLTSAGPVPIFFSTDPPNDVPANRMRMANTPSPSPPVPVPIPVSPKSIPSPSQGGLRPPAERHATATASNQNQNQLVIPRTNFIPQAVTVRPRSRSFSGFDSPTIPAAQQKEKRFA